MQQQNTRSALLHHSSAIFLIRFFPSLANLLVILYFSKRLSLEAYGQYQHIWAQYYILTAVALAGLPAFALTVGFPSFIAFVKSWPAARKWLLVGWPVLWSVVFAVLQLAGVLSFPLSFCFLLSAVAGMALEGLLLAGRRFQPLLALNMVYTVFFLWLHYVFFSGQYSLSWLFTCLTVLGMVRVVCMLPFFFKKMKADDLPTEKGNAGKSAGGLWLHLGFFELSQVVFRWADKFIVSLFLSAGALAIYYNGSLEIPFLPLLIGAAGSALLLHMHAPGNVDSLARKNELVYASGVVLSSLVLPLFFFLLFFAQPLFRLALSEKYLSALPVFWVMLLVLPLRAYNFVTLLQHLQKGAVINAGVLLDVVLALGLCYPLYQIMGLPGIALSFVTGTYAQAGFYLYHLSRLTRLRIHKILPLQNWLLKLLVLAFLFAGLRFFLARTAAAWLTLLYGGIGLVVSCLLLLLLDFRFLKRFKKV